MNLQGADEKPSDPSDVLEGWLRFLGMDGAEIPPTLEARMICYRSWLANKRALVLLDNAHDEAQVRPLLPGGAGCGVIVTSRKKLAALAGTQPLDLKMLRQDEALALLAKLIGTERVQAERTAAEKIVRLCGYLPLAVLIAGGVLKGKSHWALGADYLPKLADERKRLDVLKQVQGGDVRASFNLSYQQLGEAERRLFGLLGTLTGDFGLPLAAYVGEVTAEESEEIVERLIDAQLIEVTQQRRYRYHDLMRLYAQEQLLAEAQRAAQERAFDWYWGGASYCGDAFSVQRRRQVAAEQSSEASEAERENNFYQTAMAWFEAERVHLLAAFEWGYEQKKYDRIVSFAGNLADFFKARSYWQDWEHTHVLALVAARESNNKQGESQTLNNLGIVYRSQGCWDDAITQYEQSLEIMRSLGDRHREGTTLMNVGNAYQLQGRWEDAIMQYEQSLEIRRSLDDRHGEGQTLSNLGYLFATQNQYPKAIDYWQTAQTKLHPDSPEAKQIAQELKQPYGSIQQRLTRRLPYVLLLILLLFAAFNLLRGHWLIATLTLLTFAAFLTYRLWKRRRGHR